MRDEKRQPGRAWVACAAALAAAAATLWAAGGSHAQEPGASAESLGAAVARADIAVRSRAADGAVLLLSGHAELRRGSSSLEADRVVIWIDEADSARLGKVVMEVYAEGDVLTVEHGVRMTSPRVFFRWTASEFTVDDADGFITLEDKPLSGPFFDRAREVRSAGAAPALETVLAPRSAPPVGELPPSSGSIVGPGRIGLIYGQQQEGPDIKSVVEGDYRVTTVTRYPDVVFHDPGSDIGRMEILAENMVIWVNEKKLQAGGTLREADVQVYAEGHVVIYEARQTIQCERLFYDFKNQRGLMVGGTDSTVVVKTFARERQVPVYYRAKEFRRISANEYVAKNAMITTCEFAKPDWGMLCSEVRLTSGSRTVTDEEGRTSEVQAMERAQAWNARLMIHDLPVFYWPYFTRDLKGNRSILKSVRTVSSSQFGAGVQTEWGLYDIGLYENDWSDLRFLLDYYSKRGVGLGFKFSYDRPEHWGDLFAYTIDDSGTDKNGLAPEDPRRSRVKWQHRSRLSEHWRLDAEFSWLSDSQFLNEFWEKEFKEEKEQESLAHLRYLDENRLLSVLGKFRTSDFQTQNEYMPEARFTWLGQPLFGGIVTYLQDTHVGNVRRRWNDELQKPGLLPDDFSSLRAITEHEFQLPFRLGFVKLAPFVNLAYSYYDRVVSGGHDRVAVTAGVRSSASFWRIYDYYNRLWDVNRLRHIITPTIDVFENVELTKDPDEIYQFDEFDSVADRKVIRFGLRQRLETKRIARQVEPAAVGGWYNVNWMVLDLELDYYPDAERYNAGNDFSPLHAEYLWQVSDRVALLSKADVRVDTGPTLETFDVGVIFNRSPKMSLYLGQRYIRASDSNIFIGKLDYKLDERWTMGFFGQVDFGQGETNDYRVVLKRRLHRWIMELGYEFDAGQNDHSFSLMFYPQGLPEAKLRFF